jgi:hypothetical protein
MVISSFIFIIKIKRKSGLPFYYYTHSLQLFTKPVHGSSSGLARLSLYVRYTLLKVMNKIHIGGFGAWPKSLPATYMVIISECRSNIRDILVSIGDVQARIRDILPELLGSLERIWVIMLCIRNVMVRTVLGVS